VGRDVLVSLLITGVFGDVVKVFATDDDGTVHLGGNNGAGQDAASNGHKTGEGAFLVNIASLNGGLWCAETQTDILIPSSPTLSDLLALGLRLGVDEDVRLLLERTFRLDGQLGRHNCEMIDSNTDSGRSRVGIEGD